MTAPNTKRSAAYGIWPSPITAAVVAAGASPLSQPQLDGDAVYWLAGRASEGGRTTMLRQRGSEIVEMTPAPFNVRTRVHEYGGGASLVAAGVVWFSHFADNRIYVIRDGQIAESGSHQELTLMDNGLYASLIKLQFENTESN